MKPTARRVVMLIGLGTQAARAAAPTDSPALLPGNHACPYPPEALQRQVAGVVRFTARLRPDGTVWSVEIPKVPWPSLGFEESVRACVSGWRFEPATSGEDASRTYEGRVRFQRASSEEALVRARLEELAAAWNERDETAIAQLQAQPKDAAGGTPIQAAPLLGKVQATLGAGAGQIRLAEDVDLYLFLRPDEVNVRQLYQRIAADGAALPAEAIALDASLWKGSRGWRFVSLAASSAGRSALRVGTGQIKEPRKLKNVPPYYPEEARRARVQGVVILEATISPEGAVTHLKVLRGIPLLDQAAIDAVKQWRYTPTLLDGTAVPVIMTVTVNFRLN